MSVWVERHNGWMVSARASQPEGLWSDSWTVWAFLWGVCVFLCLDWFPPDAMVFLHRPKTFSLGITFSQVILTKSLLTLHLEMCPRAPCSWLLANSPRMGQRQGTNFLPKAKRPVKKYIKSKYFRHYFISAISPSLSSLSKKYKHWQCSHINRPNAFKKY